MPKQNRKPEKPPADKKAGPKVVLDFTGREELYQQLVEIARHDERTVPAQIFYWLKRHLPDFVGAEIELSKRIRGDK